VGVEKLDLLRFGFGFVFLRHRNVVERHAKEIGVALSVGMVADHQRKVAGEFAIALAMQQIHQAVIVLGNEDGYPRPAIAHGEHPIHAELVRDRAEGSIKIAQVQAEVREIPFNTSQIKALFAGLMLLEMENVAVVAIDEFGESGVQSLAVGTLHEQDRGVLH
jgi:hypothetical protein